MVVGFVKKPVLDSGEVSLLLSKFNLADATVSLSIWHTQNLQNTPLFAAKKWWWRLYAKYLEQGYKLLKLSFFIFQLLVFLLVVAKLLQLDFSWSTVFLFKAIVCEIILSSFSEAHKCRQEYHQIVKTSRLQSHFTL